MTYFNRFPDKTVFAALHVMSLDQVTKNIEAAFEANVDGVFLTHSGPGSTKPFEAVIEVLHREGWFDRLWIGANFCKTNYAETRAASLRLQLEGLWSKVSLEDLQTRSFDSSDNPDARICFDSIALGNYTQDEELRAAGQAIAPFCDVVTTTTPSNCSIPIHRLQLIREAIGDHPLILNDSIWPHEDNVETLHPKLVDSLLPYVDGILADWGVRQRSNPYEFDVYELKRLVAIVHAYQPLS